MESNEVIIDAFVRCMCHENEGCPGCYQNGPGFGFECRKALCKDVAMVLRSQQSEIENLHNRDGFLHYAGS